MSNRLASWITACCLVACLPESADLSGYSRDWESLDPSVEPFPDSTVGGASSGPSVGAAGAGGASNQSGTGGTEGSTTLPLSPPSGTGGSGSGSASAGGAAGGVEDPTNVLGGGAGTTGSAGSAPIPTEPFCDVGLLSPDETTCLFASITIASWQAARDACAAQQASLARVDSMAEDAVVQTLSSESVWLGGSDTIADNVFVWLDGSPIAFGNWGANQPDRFPGADCIEKRGAEGGLWYDQPCFNERFFICEKPSQ